MSNGDTQANCILDLCCEGEEGCKALAKKMHDEFPFLSESQSYTLATWFKDHYDLAEKGTLKPLKDSWKRLLNADNHKVNHK